MIVMLAPLIERQQIVRRSGGTQERVLYPVAVMRQKPLKRHTPLKRTPLRSKTMGPLRKPSFFRRFSLRKTLSSLFSSYRGAFAPKGKQILIFCVVFLALVAAVLVSLFLISRTPRIDSLSLPPDGVIEELLLEYASPPEAMGGGDLPPLSLLTGGEPRAYTVKKNDTIAGIAKSFNLDAGTLISYNQIQDVRRIAAGTELKIPGHDGIAYRVRSGDSLSGIAGRLGVRLNDILDMNDLETDVIRPGMELFIPGARLSEYEYRKAMGTLVVYPTKGRLTSPFGNRIDPFLGVKRMHYGIDLANSTGTTIVAAMDGTVALVDERPMSFGKYILIKHSGGLQTLYGHLSEFSVKTGDRVKQGQKIGEMGNTGMSTGSHLHFAIYKNNIPVDPLKGYLR